MKKFVSRWKREDGAVAIFMAFAMVAMIGFTALAVDYGLYYTKKAQVQTACDAAVLAAVYNLPDTNQATQTALSYIEKNGFSPSDAVVSFNDSNTSVSVTGNIKQDAYFSKIFGLSYMNMTCKAKAMIGVQSGGGVFDYLLFYGDTSGTLDMGGRFNVYGSVHSNAHLYANPGYGYILGAARARLISYCNPWTCTVGAVISGAEFVPMTDFTDCVDQVMPKSWNNNPTPASINAEWRKVTFTGNTKVQPGDVKISNKCSVSGNLYVDGNFSVSGDSPVCTLDGGLIYATGNINFGNTFNGDGCIFAKGDITFTGSKNIITENAPICLYSENGNITLTPASTHVYGIVYAPNGTVTIGGNNTTFHGSIIGKRINGIPAQLTMYSNEIELPFTIGSRVAILTE